MAHYLAELYSPKPTWLALDQNGRRRFFETVGAGMGPLTALGVEALAFGETEAETLHAPDQKFFAIWRAPNAAAIAALISGISASGWHDYFATLNASGEDTGMNGHLAHLTAL